MYRTALQLGYIDPNKMKMESLIKTLLNRPISGQQLHKGSWSGAVHATVKKTRKLQWSLMN